jgi:hypothetical protein
MKLSERVEGKGADAVQTRTRGDSNDGPLRRRPPNGDHEMPQIIDNVGLGGAEIVSLGGTEC